MFNRPKTLKHDSFEEDEAYHQAFKLHMVAFDEAVVTLKEADDLLLRL